jgi:predicted RNA-binding Zn-ribbon protein involved in translation (DUF1610 family)
VTSDEWDHPESGTKARKERIVQAINKKLASVGIHGEHRSGDANRTLDWNDEHDRALVRDKFAANASESAQSQEAILPAFGQEGRGENARDDCGNPHPFLCTSCANTVEFGRTCSQSVCARCGVAWVRDTAIRKAAKVRRLRKEKFKRSPDDVNQYTHHLAISAPLAWYYDLAASGLTMEEAQETTREIIKSILEELRAQGILIRHSFRGEKPDGSIKGDRHNHNDLGDWKERLNSDRDWYGDVRDELAWQPHYHCIVVSDHVKTRPDDDEDVGLTEHVEAQTGFVIHRIEDEDGKSLPNDGAMARALIYSLSHGDLHVYDGGHNQSCNWEVGAFKGDKLRSSPDLASRPTDLDWADGKVRAHSGTILGLTSGTTDCGASIPAVDDPDELAQRVVTELDKKVFDEIWPQHEPVDVDPDLVLQQISAGNLHVSTTSNNAGGYDVTVADAAGNRLDQNAGTLPDLALDPFDYSEDGDLRTVLRNKTDDASSCESSCDCDDHADTPDQDDDQHDTDDGPTMCDGELVPLEEARKMGLFDDPDWLAEATFAADAIRVHEEYDDDLRMFGPPPGKAVGAG